MDILLSLWFIFGSLMYFMVGLPLSLTHYSLEAPDENKVKPWKVLVISIPFGPFAFLIGACLAIYLTLESK